MSVDEAGEVPVRQSQQVCAGDDAGPVERVQRLVDRATAEEKVAMLEAICAGIAVPDGVPDRDLGAGRGAAVGNVPGPHRAPVRIDDLAGSALVHAAVRVHRSAERLLGARLHWLGRMEAEGWWASDGASDSFISFVAASHRLSRSRARSDVILARKLRDWLPHTAAALQAGRVGLAQAGTLARVAATSEARRAALAEIAEADADDQTGDAEGSGGSEVPEHRDGSGEPVGRPGAAVTVEETLLRHSRQVRPDDFITVAKHFAAIADPDACERGFREATAREYLELSRTTDGFHLSGFLTEDHGQRLRARLQGLIDVHAEDERSYQQHCAHALLELTEGGPLAGEAPDHAECDDSPGGTSVAGSSARAGALTGARQRTRAGAGAGRNVAQIGVVLSWADLERLGLPRGGGDPAGARPGGRDLSRDGPDCRAPSQVRPPASHPPGSPPVGSTPGMGTSPPAPLGGSAPPGAAVDREGQRRDWSRLLAAPPPRWFDGTGPVPDTVLRELLDAAEVFRVVLGPDGAVTDLGRTRRVFPARLRNAVIARDQGCAFPGCGLPAPYCQVHHVIPWCEQGRTCLDNAALLCGHHNRLLDAKRVSMVRRGVAASARPGVGAAGTGGAGTGGVEAESSREIGMSSWRFYDRRGHEIVSPEVPVDA